MLLFFAGTSLAAPQGGSGTAAGYCLAFDGVDDLVHVARSVALEPPELTVELWARLDGPQDWNSRLLRKGEHDAYFLTAEMEALGELDSTSPESMHQSLYRVGAFQRH